MYVCVCLQCLRPLGRRNRPFPQSRERLYVVFFLRTWFYMHTSAVFPLRVIHVVWSACSPRRWFFDVWAACYECWSCARRSQMSVWQHALSTSFTYIISHLFQTFFIGENCRLNLCYILTFIMNRDQTDRN